MPKKPTEPQHPPTYTPADPVNPVRIPGIELYGGTNPPDDDAPTPAPAPADSEE